MLLLLLVLLVLGGRAPTSLLLLLRGEPKGPPNLAVLLTLPCMLPRRR